MTTPALRQEELRDLRAQMGALLDGEDEVAFQDNSPRRRVDFVYSMETGERIPVLLYHLPDVMAKVIPGTSTPMFTGDPSKAPPHREGKIKCFMAEGSPEREILVNELGIFRVCPAEKLANRSAAILHAEHKHKSEWRQYQDFMAEQEREEDRQRQQAQINAMLEVARGVRQEPEHICDVCGDSAKNAAGLAAHKRSHNA